MMTTNVREEDEEDDDISPLLAPGHNATHDRDDSFDGPLLSEVWLEKMLREYPKSEGDLPSEYRMMLEEAGDIESDGPVSDDYDFLEN